MSFAEEFDRLVAEHPADARRHSFDGPLIDGREVNAMDVAIKIKVNVTPGTLTTEDEIKADLLQSVDSAAFMAGFSYGAEKYTVNSVTPE